MIDSVISESQACPRGNVPPEAGGFPGVKLPVTQKYWLLFTNVQEALIVDELQSCGMN